MTDFFVNASSLLRRRKKFWCSIISYWHIMEIPYKICAQINHGIIKFFRSNRIIVCTGVAAGNAIDQFLFPKKGHCFCYFLINTVSAAAVSGFFKAFDADSRDEVTDAQHFVCEVFVDERGVRKREKLAVAVLFAQGNEVLFAHERLAAGVNIQVYAELFAMRDGRNYRENKSAGLP